MSKKNRPIHQPSSNNDTRNGGNGFTVDHCSGDDFRPNWANWLILVCVLVFVVYVFTSYFLSQPVHFGSLLVLVGSSLFIYSFYHGYNAWIRNAREYERWLRQWNRSRASFWINQGEEDGLLLMSSFWVLYALDDNTRLWYMRLAPFLVCGVSLYFIYLGLVGLV